LAAAALAAFGVVTACSNQGEGEVCDIAVGSSDCQDGLTCIRSPDMNIAGSPHPYRCCPSGTSTVAGCAAVITPNTTPEGGSGGSSDGATPEVDGGDAATPDAATHDASTGPDAATAVDGGGDAGPDAETIVDGAADSAG
jgi:hypothetical protein